METETKTTTVETEATTPKEASAQPSVDMSSIMKELKAIGDRMSKLEENKLSNDEIRKIAEKNVIEAKVKEEEENIRLANRVSDLEKRKTKIDLRNEMWETMTQQFINEEIPRTHIRAALLDEGWNGELGQMLSLALLRYLAPMNGISLDQLNSISLIAGEKAFRVRNTPKNVITMHGRV